MRLLTAGLQVQVLPLEPNFFQGIFSMSDSPEPVDASKLEKLIARYEEFHQHSTNKLIHYICVPAIAFSLIGLLWCIKIADIAIPTTAYFLTLNVGVVFICLAAIYYLSISLGSFLGMIFFGFLACLA